jgi:hypothetical protein
MRRNAAGFGQMEGRFDAVLWRPRLQIEHLTVAGATGVPAPHLFDGAKWRWRGGGPICGDGSRVTR